MNTNEIPTPRVDSGVYLKSKTNVEQLNEALDFARQLERELHESRQREARFVAMISTLPTRIAFDKDLLAFTNSSMARVQAAKEIVDLHFSKALSTTPAETMVPLSVVYEFLSANESMALALQQNKLTNERAERYAEALANLQAYAPKKGQP